MKHARSLALVIAAAAARSAAAGETIQLTDSDRDSSLERAALTQLARWIAVRSTGDLTPGAPGNADGSAEIWRVDVVTGAIVQATATGLDQTCVRVTFAGDLFLASRDDLTPGVPGNADASFEVWHFDGTPGTLRQVTAGPRDSFFQTWRDLARTALIGSRSDLVPGGNADGGSEVYAWDAATGTTRQLTETDATAVLRGVTKDARGILESTGDLAPGGNADGSSEVFLLDLDTAVVRQLTDSAGNARFVGLDREGRRVAVESRADLVPGSNPDGSLEVFVVDRRTRSLQQATSGLGDAAFAAFVPKSDLLAFTTRDDLLPGGNPDGSQEIYTVELSTGVVRQVTASDQDSSLLEMGYAPTRWAATLRGEEVHVQRIRRGVASPSFRLGGAAGTGFGGMGLHGRRVAFDTTEDVVAGGNADGSREVYVAELGPSRPRFAQITASATDSRTPAISELLPIVIVESRADLVPGRNTDGSQELFAHRRGNGIGIPR